MSARRRARMPRGEPCGALSRLVPGLQAIGIRRSAPRVPRALEHRVVLVPSRLAPGVKDDLAEGAIRRVGAHKPPERIVTQERCNTPFPKFALVLELGRVGEEWLVLLDGIALVVEHRAPGADPPMILVADADRAVRRIRETPVGLARRHGSRLGSHLLLDLAT